MKIFAISDVHGHFKEMIEALNEAGYDPNNDNHLLISCGDNFDRGEGSERAYEWLKGLKNAVMLKGNHEVMLEDYLTGKNVSPFNYLHNGTDKTLDAFLGRTSSFVSWCLLEGGVKEPTYADFARFIESARKDINKDYPDLLNWLKNMPYYYETKHYIFTHGAIDTTVEDWHYPKATRYKFRGWEALIWNDGSFFGEDIKNTDKTVVIGHFHTRHLREMYNVKDNKNLDDILVRKGKQIIAIDGCTVLSKKVNVLVVEDEL